MHFCPTCGNMLALEVRSHMPAGRPVRRWFAYRSPAAKRRVSATVQRNDSPQSTGVLYSLSACLTRLNESVPPSQREEGMRFFCRTCPYIYQLKSKVKNEAALQHNKLQNDPLGGPDAWKNAAESDGAHTDTPRAATSLPCMPCSPAHLPSLHM